MPLYFFDTFNGHEVVRDDEGEHVSSMDEVRRQALADARELVADVIARGDYIDGRELRVRDEAGEVVFTISFMDVIAAKL